MTRGLGGRIERFGPGRLVSALAAVLCLVVVAGGAQAGPTTVKVITEDGPAAGVEVWVYDAESGEKLRYGRTNQVGEVEFDDLDDSARYEAQTLDGAHRTEVFSGNEGVVPLALDGGVPVMPIVEEEVVVVEEEVEEQRTDPTDAPSWGADIWFGLGGGASSYDYDLADTGGEFVDSDDGTYGIGVWQVGMQVMGPSWLIFLEKPRPFVRLMFEGDFNDAPEANGSGACSGCGTAGYTSTLLIETDFRMVGAIGVAIPMELIGWKFELEPYFGFGGEWYTATAGIDRAAGQDFGSDSLEGIFVLIEPGISASLPVWEYGPMELRAYLGLAADIYLGDDTYRSTTVQPGVSATFSRSFNIQATIGVKARFDGLETHVSNLLN